MESLKGLPGYSSVSFSTYVRIQAHIYWLEPSASISLSFIGLQYHLLPHGEGLHLGFPPVSKTFVPVHVYFLKDYNSINENDSTT